MTTPFDISKQFDEENLYDPPDPNKTYKCSRYTSSKGWTLLMKLVVLTKKHPELHNKIKQLIDSDKNMLNVGNFNMPARKIFC